MTEERKTSSTGGQKGQKLARFDLISWTWLWQVATVCGFGAKKYDDDNWRKGYSWRLSYGAMQRHLTSFWTGENYDQESGLHHLAHAAWHCMVLYVFSTVKRYSVFDDRPDVPDYKYGPETDPLKKTVVDWFNERQLDALRDAKDGDVVVCDSMTGVPEDDHGDCTVRSYSKDIERTESLLGHRVDFVSDYEGYIDGRYCRGTQFTSTVQRYRNGFETIDDEIAASLREKTSP